MKLPAFLQRADADLAEDFQRVTTALADMDEVVKNEVDAIVIKTTSQIAEEALQEFSRASDDARLTLDNAVRKVRNALPGLRQKLTEEIASLQAMMARIDAQIAALPTDAPAGEAPAADRQSVAQISGPPANGAAVEAK